jgi:hypothetical protein
MGETIVVNRVGKQFRRYHQDRPWTLQEVFQRGFRRIKPAERFWALRDVSFAVASGRSSESWASMERANPPCCACSAEWGGPTRAA